MKKPQVNSYVIRYADVLLDYAEAENKLNGSAAAYGYLNKVHRRSNPTDIPIGLSTNEFSDAIYKERGFEFVGEGLLYFDELRTDRIGEKVKNHVAWGNQQGIYMYVNAPLEFVPSKNFLFKIPQYDFDSNPALLQNPDNISK